MAMYSHEIKLIVKQISCIKLIKYWDKYTEMHGQQNVKKLLVFVFQSNFIYRNERNLKNAKM